MNTSLSIGSDKRHHLVAWLRAKIPSSYWQGAWWLAPILALILFQLLLLVLIFIEPFIYDLGDLNSWTVYSLNKLRQLLALITLLGAPLVSRVVSNCIELADLEAYQRKRAVISANVVFVANWVLFLGIFLLMEGYFSSYGSSLTGDFYDYLKSW
jgi:hypothetical protein